MLEKIYHSINKFLFEIVMFFFLQAVLLFVLAFLILFYPYILNLLVAVGFFVAALVSVCLMIRVGIIYHDWYKVRKLIGGNK